MKIRYDESAKRWDIARDGRNIELEHGLETAVTISLFTDARLPSGQDVPGGGDERRGWWGSAFDEAGIQFGSRLWTLSRSKPVAETLRLAEEYAKEALAWMVTDGVVESVETTAEAVTPELLGMVIALKRPGDAAPKYLGRWEVQLGI